MGRTSSSSQSAAAVVHRQQQQQQGRGRAWRLLLLALCLPPPSPLGALASHGGSDPRNNISRECLEAFIGSYADRFKDCSACFRASNEAEAEGAASVEALRGCCSLRKINCGHLFSDLDLVLQHCTEEDEDHLNIDVVLKDGTEWETTCQAVNNETSSPPHPPPPGQLPPPPPPPSDGATCTSADAGQEPSLCMVFGDPHVLQFSYERAGGGMLTCRSTGEVTLLDNAHLRVTAVAEAVKSTSPKTSMEGATILTSVRVAYKDASCGEGRTFRPGSVGKWEDGELGTAVAVSEQGLQSGQRFLSVLLSTPLVTASSSGWCVGGCPGEEVDGVQQLLRGSGRRRLMEGERHKERAVSNCAAMGLGGEFLDACSFDTAFSGDKAFLEAAVRDARVFTLARGQQLAGGEGGSSGAGSRAGSGAWASVLAAAVGCVCACALLVL